MGRKPQPSSGKLHQRRSRRCTMRRHSGLTATRTARRAHGENNGGLDKFASASGQEAFGTSL